MDSKGDCNIHMKKSTKPLYDAESQDRTVKSLKLLLQQMSKLGLKILANPNSKSDTMEFCPLCRRKKLEVISNFFHCSRCKHDFAFILGQIYIWVKGIGVHTPNGELIGDWIELEKYLDEEKVNFT
jgi:hypothetical protein